MWVLYYLYLGHLASSACRISSSSPPSGVGSEPQGNIRIYIFFALKLWRLSRIYQSASLMDWAQFFRGATETELFPVMVKSLNTLPVSVPLPYLLLCSIFSWQIHSFIHCRTVKQVSKTAVRKYCICRSVLDLEVSLSVKSGLHRLTRPTVLRISSHVYGSG